MTNAKLSSTDFPPDQPPEYGLLPNSRPRSLWGQFGMALLQPGRFFRTLPSLPDNRQWVWAALLILLLAGLSAVQANSSAPIPSESLPPGGDFGPMPGDPFGGGASGGGAAAISGGGGAGPVAGPEIPGAGAPGGGGESNPAEDWTTALIAASNIVVMWAIVTLLLAVVSLLRGVPPQWNHNIQIAIWASVPLGLMAALQLVYFFAGGTAGEPGMAGLLPEWDAYADLPESQQALALSLASRATLFSLWTVVLVYMGGRQALRGQRWVVALVTLALVALVVAIPVAAGTITAPEDEAIRDLPGGVIGPEGLPGEPPPGVEFPGDEAPGIDVSPEEAPPGEGPLEDMLPAEESGEAPPAGATETAPEAVQ